MSLESFAKTYLASQGIGRETRKRCCGVPVTERRDPRVEITGEVPEFERGDLP